jgi:hypothetical protein
MLDLRSRGLRRKALLSMLLFGLLAATLWFSVSAQSGMAIKSASLQLWPEYDDPGLLVLFTGTFSDAAGFPRQVAFPLPQGARGIQATVNDPLQGLLSLPWQIVEGSLAYTLPLPSFHVEYYLDRPPSGDQRDISYTFQVPYATDALTVTVQQPARATGFSVTPQPNGSYVGTDELTYYTITQESLQAGSKLDFRIRYSKSDNGLTAPKPATTSASTNPSSGLASAGGASALLPWLLIALGALALLGAGLYWGVLLPRRGSKPATASIRATPTRPREEHLRPAGGDGGGGYCTQCGRRLAPSDRFCANCGAPRRT